MLDGEDSRTAASDPRPTDEHAIDASALSSFPPPKGHNDWLGWLATLYVLGFTADEAETWSAQDSSNYSHGEATGKWEGLGGLAKETLKEARDKLRGHAHNASGWKAPSQLRSRSQALKPETPPRGGLAGGTDYELEAGYAMLQIPVIEAGLVDLSNKRGKEGQPAVFSGIRGTLSRLMGDTIQALDTDTVLDVLKDAGRWGQMSRNGEWIYEDPKREARSAIIKRKHYPGLPHLTAIVSAPRVLPGWKILDRAGYFEDVGILSRIPDLGDPIPLQDAQAVLEDAFGDFKYVNAQSKSNAFAALFTLALRTIDPDMVSPMFAFTKAKPQSGASTLAECMFILMLAETPVTLKWGKDAEELDKLIAKKFLEGAPVLFFNNLITAYGSGTVTSLITEGKVEIRLLGKNQTVINSNPVTIFITCNATWFHEDFHTRICQSELAWDKPRLANEKLTDAVSHVPVIPWMKKNRLRLLRAVCAVLHEARERAEKQQLGYSRFPVWEQTINAVLSTLELLPVSVGVHRGTSIESAGTLGRDVIEALHRQIGSEPVTIDGLVLALHDEGTVEVSRLKGVKGVNNDGEITWRDEGKRRLGIWITSIIKGRDAIEVNGTVVSLSDNDQNGARRRFALLEEPSLSECAICGGPPTGPELDSKGRCGQCIINAGENYEA